MVFEDLKENYTKVSYAKPLLVEPKRKILSEKKMSKLPKILIKVAIAGVIFFITTDATVFASSLDEKAEKMYYEKFIVIARWIVVGKGGWDVVTKALKEDFDGAKRSIVQYLIIMVVLVAFPWATNEIISIFREEI